MNTAVTRLTVPPEDAAKRLDIFLAAQTSLSRSQIQKHIDEGSVTVNGRQEPRSYRVRPQDAIEVVVTRRTDETLLPEPLPVTILFRDAHLVVVDKPAGVVVYPGPGHERSTLLNAVLYHCGKLADIGGPLRNGVVHRLDKGTSGVMVIALDNDAYYRLIEQFRKRTVTREYIALVYGAFTQDSGEISLQIGRSAHDRKKMSTRTRRGRCALTTWSVLRRFANATLIRARLGTGRTHQIRVHLSAVGHPVLGDQTYGRKRSLMTGSLNVSFPRQMLHARTLGFDHPVTGQRMEFSSPLPQDMKKAIEILEKQNSEFRSQ
jgi:23S rRNA pseudouridine1911/1915/1917 synthase